MPLPALDLDPDTDLSFTRTLAAAPAALWRCWTEPELVKAFFVPRPHRVVDCTIDLRPGGRFDTVFEVDGARMENAGVWLEVTPHSRLVFTDSYRAGWRPTAEPFMTALIEFASADGGGTLYRATARHRSPDARQSHEDMGFFEGWGIVADQLDAVAQGLPA